MNDNTTKTCSKCGLEKELTEFYKDKTKSDGFTSACKSCRYERKHELRVIRTDEGKFCVTCGQLKSVSEFQKSKRESDGHMYECKVCRSEKWKQYYQENKEKVNQKNTRYAKENCETIREYRKNYYIINRERHAINTKKWYLKNYEKHKVRSREYFKTPKGRELDFRNKMKRRSYKHKVSFTPMQRKKLLDRDNWTCQSCGCKVHDKRTGDWNTPDKAHIDHIIPISKGGNSEPSNLQVLCRTCNLSKHDYVEEQLKMDFNTI